MHIALKAHKVAKDKSGKIQEMLENAEGRI